jgi:hypothetical protein
VPNPNYILQFEGRVLESFYQILSMASIYFVFVQKIKENLKNN